MFMVGISKIVVTLLLIVGVWYGFKLLARMGRVGGAVAGEGLTQKGQAAAEACSSATIIEDLRPCLRCGAYVPGSQPACERKGCPFGTSRASTDCASEGG